MICRNSGACEVPMQVKRVSRRADPCPPIVTSRAGKVPRAKAKYWRIACALAEADWAPWMAVGIGSIYKPLLRQSRRRALSWLLQMTSQSPDDPGRLPRVCRGGNSMTHGHGSSLREASVVTSIRTTAFRELAPHIPERLLGSPLISCRLSDESSAMTECRVDVTKRKVECCGESGVAC